MASAGKMTIDIRDAATPWLKWAMDRFPEFQRKALKSTGWYGSSQIKKGIKKGAPGGKRYKPTISKEDRQILESSFRTPKKRYPILGKLLGAVGYHYDKSTKSVVIGWLSKSAVRLGTMHEFGFSIRVTNKMRMAIAANDLGLTKKRVFKIPARPTVAPMAAFLSGKWAPYIEEKMWSYLQKGAPVQKPKSKRKYIVLGAM